MGAESIKDKTGGIVVAFSGGSDSLGLLALLVQQMGPSDLVAVYVDHGVRSRAEIEAETALNEANCRKLGVRFEVCRLSPEKVRSSSAAEGAEGALRALRYEALEERRRALGFRWIATGHTLDDQAETVLMRLLSGKAPASLAGIPAVNGAVIRPALGKTRGELEEVCRKAGLRWSVDSTNAQDLYLRNKLRHCLIPEVARLFPSYRDALAAFAESMRSLDVEEITSEEVSGGLPLARFEGLPRLMKDILLHRYWSLALGDGFVSLSRGLAGRILDAVDSGRAAYIVSGGVAVEVFGGRLLIGRQRKEEPFCVGLDLSLPGERIPLPGGRILARGTGVAPGRIDGESVRVPPCAIEGRAVVRNPRRNDAIELKDGRKLVSDLLREMGIPRSRRALVPVLADESQILAVLGRAFGGRDRICRKCRANLAPNDLSLYIVVE